MSRAFLSLMLISVLSAQTANNAFEKAPPDVDAALRDRVSKFYEAHVDRSKLRQTELYVAEESKDWFFANNKPACLSFKIDSITYSDNSFTKARVVVFCKMRIMQPGFAGTPMDVPLPDHWKIENGQWFWYLDQSQGIATPMGYSKLKPADSGGDGPQLPGGVTLESMLKAVQANKESVILQAGSSEQVLIANSLPGSVTLKLETPRVAGLTASLDRTALEHGEKATVTLRYEAGAASRAVKSAQVIVLVEPLKQTIPIQVELK